jgi:thioredoxin reductase (NADPH)
MHDLIIIGAGPAGLTAGIYAVRRGLDTLVLEAKPKAGGLLLTYPDKKIENYPGFPDGILAGDLVKRMVQQAEKTGVKIACGQEVVKLELNEKVKRIKTTKGEFSATTVIIASGVGGTPRKLGIPGEQEAAGHHVFYHLPDKKQLAGKKVLVIGGGDTALESAIRAADVADVKIAHRKDCFRASEALEKRIKESKAEIFWNTELLEIKNKEKVKACLVNNKTGKKTEVPVDVIIINIGFVLSMELFENAGIKLEKKRISVDREQRTNIPGVFAAGDVTGGLCQISTAVGEGAIAAVSAYKYIKQPYWA